MNIVVQATPADIPELERILESEILETPKSGDVFELAKFITAAPLGSVFDNDVEIEILNSINDNTEEHKLAKRLCMTSCVSLENKKAFNINIKDVKECVEAAKKMKLSLLYLFVNPETLKPEHKRVAAALQAKNYTDLSITPKKTTEFSVPRFATRSWKK